MCVCVCVCVCVCESVCECVRERSNLLVVVGDAERVGPVVLVHVPAQGFRGLGLGFPVDGSEIITKSGVV